MSDDVSQHRPGRSRPSLSALPPVQAAPADSMSLARAHEQLARIVLDAQPLGATLDLIAGIALEQLPGMNETSITLIDRDRPRSMGVQGRHAILLDERQYERGYGPCLHAAATGATIAVEDTSSDTSYPDFARQAAAVGIRHSLSIALPMTVPGQTAALNLYGSGAPLDPVSRDVAHSFAGYAAVALTNAAVLAGALTEVEQMRSAMAFRAAIEQAKGIIMAKRGCTEDEAFDLLRQASNESQLKLRDIAQDLVQFTAGQRKPVPPSGAGRHSAKPSR
jgi:GAF domain-containing protein